MQHCLEALELHSSALASLCSAPEPAKLSPRLAGLHWLVLGLELAQEASRRFRGLRAAAKSRVHMAPASQLQAWPRRAHTMRVLPPKDLTAMATRLEAAPLALVAAAGGPPLLQALPGSSDALAAACSPTAPCVPLLIGPEGDFTGMRTPAGLPCLMLGADIGHSS